MLDLIRQRNIISLRDYLKARSKALIVALPVVVILFFFLAPILSFQCLGSGGGGYYGTVSPSCDVIGSGLVHDALTPATYWSNSCGGGLEYDSICPAPAAILPLAGIRKV